MQRIRVSSTVILIALILFITLFVFFTYTFLHELGHALAGLFFGQSLTEFNVSFWNLKAHVGMAGGELASWQLAVRSAAGTAMPLLVWVIFINFVPRKASFSLELLKLISSMAVVNTFLAWIVLPALFYLGRAPSDDVTNFLRYSQMPPLFLTFIAIALYIGGWILLLSKINGFQNEFLLFRSIDQEALTTGTRTTVSILAAIIIVCLIFIVTLDALASKNSLMKFSPPQGFEPVAQIDLSKETYSTEILTSFSLETSTYVGVFVAIHNINTAYFDLSVTGSNGFHSIILHGEGYNALQDGGLWEKNLPSGNYQLVLNSHQSPGSVHVYLKIY